MKKVRICQKTHGLLVSFAVKDREEFNRILTTVRGIFAREYIPNQQEWRVPATESNVELLRSLNFQFEHDISLPPIDKWIEPWAMQPLPDVPDYLRPYQVDAMRFLMWRKGRGLISTCIGSGKTIMALAWMRMTESLPALIICPATIKKQWYNQYRTFVDKKSNVDILYGQTPHGLFPNTTYIINWDILSYWKPVLLTYGFKVVIADESHRCSSSKSQRSRALSELSKAIPGFIPMSGTPIKTKPQQFFPVLNMLDPKLFKSEWAFLQRYCNPTHNGFGWEYKGSSNEQELFETVREYMIRRERKDIQKDLPEKQTSVIPLAGDMPRNYYLDSVEKFKRATGTDIQAAFNNLKLEAFALKQDFVVKWIEEFVEDGGKLLVGTYHRKVSEFLIGKFGKCARLVYGGMNSRDREKAIEDFKTRADVKILFAQILAAGEGIDGLQHVCADVAYAEFAHSPADHEQFTGRLHRDGQKESVNEYYLIADGTVEDDIVEMLDLRRAVFDAVVRGRKTEQTDFIQYLKNKVMGREV